MNDDLNALENELKRLRPRAPSSRLRAALERDLGDSPPDRISRPVPWTSSPWMRWAAAAAVAVAAGLAWRIAPRPAVPVAADGATAEGPATASAYTPVAAERTLYADADEGLVTLADGTPVRRHRSHYVDTITWRDPATNASLRWSVPREEVRLVPASFQ